MMMWLKRNLPVLVALVIFCFFVALSLFLLQGAQVKKSQIETRHRELDDKLKGLLIKNPFPSEGNIKELQRQTIQLNNYYTNIFSSLPKQHIEYTTMERWKFKGYLEKRINSIRQNCQTNGVMVGNSVNFGFGRYLGTTLPPKEEETDKLRHQLDILEGLVNLLTTAGVTEISAVRRTPVEGESLTDERVDGATWNRDPKLIYESQTVECAFRCSDEALKSVLNRLATSTNYVLLVRTISVIADKAGVRDLTGSESAPVPRSGPTGTPGPGLMDPRLGAPGAMRQPTTQTAPVKAAPGAPAAVMGNELLTATIRLDVFELKLPDEKTEPKQGKPKGDG